MKRKISLNKIFISLVVIGLVLVTTNVSAFFDRGTVRVNLGQHNANATVGDNITVTVGLSPTVDSHPPGCGMLECPDSCGDTCLDSNGNCTCAGSTYVDYYTSVKVSSSNPSVANVSYSGGVLSINAVSPGTAIITATGVLREWNNGTDSITVNVSAVPEPEPEPEPEIDKNPGEGSGEGNGSGEDINPGTGGGNNTGNGTEDGEGSFGTGDGSGTGNENGTGNNSGTENGTLQEQTSGNKPVNGGSLSGDSESGSKKEETDQNGTSNKISETIVSKDELKEEREELAESIRKQSTKKDDKKEVYNEAKVPKLDSSKTWKVYSLSGGEEDGAEGGNGGANPYRKQTASAGIILVLAGMISEYISYRKNIK